MTIPTLPKGKKTSNVMACLRLRGCASTSEPQHSPSIALRLKNADEEDLGRVTFSGIYFDNVVVNAMMDLVRRGIDKDCHWGGLTISECGGQVDAILHSSVTFFKLFSSIMVCTGTAISLQACWSIAGAMQFNDRLQCITLLGVSITREQAAIFGHGLRNVSCHLEALCMSTITFSPDAIPELLTALRENSSLRTFHLRGCNLVDAQVAALVDAVSFNNRSLKQLFLLSNQGSARTLEAVAKLLASDRLEALTLCNQSPRQGGLTGRLGFLKQAFNGNQRLRILNLGCNKLVDVDVEYLAKILSTCNRLEELGLSHNEITLRGLEAFGNPYIFPRSLHRLYLYGGDFTDDENGCHSLQQHSLKLFKENSRMFEDGMPDCGPSEVLINQQIEHFKDFNQAGRMLLEGGDKVPLSLWPVVLERADLLFAKKAETLVEERRRAANIVFHLLQGPALLHRRFNSISS